MQNMTEKTSVGYSIMQNMTQKEGKYNYQKMVSYSAS